MTIATGDRSAKTVPYPLRYRAIVNDDSSKF
jgi:hypothetical protein